MNKSLTDNFNAGYKAFSRADKRDTVKYGMRWHQVANPMKKEHHSLPRVAARMGGRVLR